MTGLRAARKRSKRRPELCILMLSMHENEQSSSRRWGRDRRGHVLKTAADRDLVEACRATMHRETFLAPAPSPPWSGTTWTAPATRTASTPHAARARRAQVRSHTSDRLADRLVTSRKTVDRHRADMRDRVDPTRYAIRRGLIAP
jgi:DNA-binding NarL/FixJ family response regulator